MSYLLIILWSVIGNLKQDCNKDINCVQLKLLSQQWHFLNPDKSTISIKKASSSIEYKFVFSDNKKVKLLQVETDKSKPPQNRVTEKQIASRAYSLEKNQFGQVLVVIDNSDEDLRSILPGAVTGDKATIQYQFLYNETGKWMNLRANSKFRDGVPTLNNFFK
jgi:hypothetical protein